MRLNTLMAIALMGVINEAAASPGVVYDDAAVSREFVRTTGYFCGNGDPVGSSLKWILNTCCEGDTNRYLRIAKETAASNTNFAYVAIALVEKHGSVSDLPFLYQYTNDVECAAGALTVMLQLGGLTEVSVNAASEYIASTNTYYVMDRCDVACELFRATAIVRATLGPDSVSRSRDTDELCDQCHQRTGGIPGIGVAGLREAW